MSMPVPSFGSSGRCKNRTSANADSNVPICELGGKQIVEREFVYLDDEC